MSALDTMNERGIHQALAELIEIKTPRRRRREALVERMSSAESELHEHDTIEGVIDFQIELVNARLAQIEAASAGEPQQPGAAKE
jgi:hypothetical protein